MNKEIDTVVTSQIDAGIDGIDTVATVYGEDYGLDPTVELFIYPVYADADPGEVASIAITNPEQAMALAASIVEAAQIIWPSDVEGLITDLFGDGGALE